MKYDACIKRIDKYLTSFNAQPLIVDIQNGNDLEKILTHFNVDGNIILDVTKFCRKDEMPRIETLLATITSETKNCFLRGLTSLLRLYGEEELRNILGTIINTTIAGRVVVMTYQCERLLHFSDLRLSRRIVICEGDSVSFPKLTFLSRELPTPSGECVVDGIEKISEIIEKNSCSNIYVITSKDKKIFSKSVYDISNLNKAYDIVVNKNNLFSSLDEKIGTDKEWHYLLKLLNENITFSEICNNEFGNFQCLEISISNYSTFSSNKKWLYFIALKLFGTKNNKCLNLAAKKASNQSLLIREIYRSILDFDNANEEFLNIYLERKKILNALGNPIDEVIDFCKIVLQKEKNAIYYLTDNTRQEKELIITLIEKYYQDLEKTQLENILTMVYPDLCAYIKDYKFGKSLLDKYFSLYTQSKVINKVMPELEKLVNEQAIKREYNLILEPRTVKIDEINKNNSILYFVDAMGVEYLSFILAKCKEKSLFADVTICTANLPSITSKNKEFVDEFQNKGIVVNFEKRLDDIKHHGTDDYDYQQRKQPIHLIRELEIIDEILNKIKLKLLNDDCEKAFMISDHGASRLAVIHNTENKWEMTSKGEHSGRCCPKTDADVQSPYATEEDGFWVLANYDRFKGGRKANVEVHGGATLEEVVVPIIEITKKPENIEVYILDKVITVSFRKKASIRIFSKTKLKNLSVCIEGTTYQATEMDNNIYKVDMPTLKKAKYYKVDVYTSGNQIASGLIFEIKKEGSQEKDLL
ncbi:BREX-4 system phosphatase PglZ [Traorella massiliensis]|uniref:BREX-4 system phosphatase PglZ n=1 Tax=Traorella massiliensis TaxID=1903263 RepID=UPI0023563EC8|nr:BREX-4 system phosphatase PglZ [Traorella massiliensis]